MRVIVATLGSRGDLHPFLAVARALHERGDDVLLLSAEPHRREVETEGVPFAPILSTHDHQRTLAHPALWHPIRGFGVLWRHMVVPSVDATTELLRLEHARHGQQLRVLASPLVLGARLGADLWDYRFTTAHTAPSSLRSQQDPMFLGSHRVPRLVPAFLRQGLWQLLDHQKLEPLAKPGIDRWRQSHGLPALTEPVFDRWIHSPQQVVGLFPAEFGPMPTDWPVPVRCVGFPLYQGPAAAPDPELDDFLGRHSTVRPAIVLYPGSSPTRAQAVLEQAAHRLLSAGQPVVYLGPKPTPLAHPLALTRPWTDLPSALTQAGAFVHHGGIGACAQGLLAGIRQRTCPSAYDQFDNSWRLSALCGRSHSRAITNATELAHDLLNHSDKHGVLPLPAIPDLAPSRKNMPNAAIQQLIGLIE